MTVIDYPIASCCASTWDGIAVHRPNAWTGFLRSLSSLQSSMPVFQDAGDVDNSKAAENLSAAYIPYEAYTHIPDLSRVLEGMKYE